MTVSTLPPDLPPAVCEAVVHAVRSARSLEQSAVSLGAASGGTDGAYKVGVSVSDSPVGVACMSGVWYVAIDVSGVQADIHVAWPTRLMTAMEAYGCTSWDVYIHRRDDGVRVGPYFVFEVGGGTSSFTTRTLTPALLASRRALAGQVKLPAPDSLRGGSRVTGVMRDVAGVVAAQLVLADPWNGDAIDYVVEFSGVFVVFSLGVLTRGVSVEALAARADLFESVAIDVSRCAIVCMLAPTAYKSRRPAADDTSVRVGVPGGSCVDDDDTMPSAKRFRCSLAAELGNLS